MYEDLSKVICALLLKKKKKEWKKKNRIPKDFQSESRQLQRSYHALHVNFLERSSMSSLATSVIETCILLSHQKIPLAFTLNLVKTVHFSVFLWDTCPGKMGTRFGCTPKGSNDNFFFPTLHYIDFGNQLTFKNLFSEPSGKLAFLLIYSLVNWF